MKREAGAREQGVKKTAGMVSVDLLMDLLIKNQLDAESRVLSQGISPFQYLTGLNPFEPPPPDPLALLDQPEELRLSLLKQAFGKDFLSTMKETLAELRKRTDPGAAWHCYSMMVQTVDTAHKSMHTLVEQAAADLASRDLTSRVPSAGSAAPAVSRAPSDRQASRAPSGGGGGGGGGNTGGGVQTDGQHGHVVVTVPSHLGEPPSVAPPVFVPHVPLTPRPGHAAQASPATKPELLQPPPTNRGEGGRGGAGGKLPAVRLATAAPSSVQQSALAGEAFLRSLVASSSSKGAGGVTGLGGVLQSPRPPASKKLRPQSARDPPSQPLLAASAHQHHAARRVITPR